MPIYKPFTPSRKFGEAGENYRDEGSEEKARKQERKAAWGGDAGTPVEIEDVASQGFEESGRPITSETAKDYSVIFSDTDTSQKAKIRSIMRVGGAQYGHPSLGQIEEAISLRKEILGDAPTGGYKGSVEKDVYEGGKKIGKEILGPESFFKGSEDIVGKTRVDSQTAKGLRKDLKVLEAVKLQTISDINTKSGYTTRTSTDVIDATSDRAIRSLAMSQGVISDINDINPEKLGSVADYYFLKKSEGKSMSQIKQSFAYDYDFLESGGEYRGINTERDIFAERSVTSMHGTQYTMADRARNISTQGTEFAEKIPDANKESGFRNDYTTEPYRAGPMHQMGMSVKELEHYNRVLPNEITTAYEGSGRGVTSYEKFAYHHEDYKIAGERLGGPEFRKMYSETSSIERAQDFGYKFKINEASGALHPDMSDVKWQRAMTLHKAVENEAKLRTQLTKEMDNAGITKDADRISYLENTGRSSDADLFKTYANRKTIGTDFRGIEYTTRVAGKNWNTKYGSIQNTKEMKDPDKLEAERQLKKKAKKIPLGGGAAGLGVILRGGGGSSRAK